MSFRFYLNSLSFPTLFTIKCRSRLSCVSLTLNQSQLSSWEKLRECASTNSPWPTERFHHFCNQWISMNLITVKFDLIQKFLHLLQRLNVVKGGKNFKWGYKRAGKMTEKIKKTLWSINCCLTCSEKCTKISQCKQVIVSRHRLSMSTQNQDRSIFQHYRNQASKVPGGKSVSHFDNFCPWFDQKGQNETH